jgi:hypothetical protein
MEHSRGVSKKYTDYFIVERASKTEIKFEAGHAEAEKNKGSHCVRSFATVNSPHKNTEKYPGCAGRGLSENA